MPGVESGREFDDDATFVLVDDQISSGIDGEEVILDLESGTYYGLNEVGAWIWEHLDEPRTVGEIRAIVVGEFDTSPEECGPDVRRFLRELLDAGLVERVDGQ